MTNITNVTNKFFHTAIGKSVQTLLWTAGAYFLTLAVGFVAQVHWNAHLVLLGVPGLVNWLLYSAKVIVDPLVPNFVSSTPLVGVPAAPSTTTTTTVVTTTPKPGTVVTPTEPAEPTTITTVPAPPLVSTAPTLNDPLASVS